MLFSIVIGYVACLIFTYTNVFPNDPRNSLYKSRTDIRGAVILDAKWFRVPYPAQWGVPTVPLSGAIGMLASIVTSIIESIGDYHACARLASLTVPTVSFYQNLIV